MLIKANNISVVRGNKKILEDINLSIDSKDFITILEKDANFGSKRSRKINVAQMLTWFF